MPAPATVDEFLELVQKSGVVDETKLKNYLAKQRDAGSLPADPSKCAGKLVRDAVLTYFQAEQLLQGKWKRFTIGKYKVLEKLGVGGMGQVFLCEHKLMRRRVAVKVLPAAKGQDDASRERFYQEARAVAALDHPNIVRAYDIDHDEGLHFLVMEFVDGVNLQDLVKRAGPLDPYRACHYIYGSAVGLQYANETGIIHRDIKPGNILIDRTGVVKILDMGLARFFNDEDDSLTKKYDENVLGTADYLAPEQAVDSHTVKITADLYSLGGTFYYLLTGLPPFPEGSVAQKLLWHQTRDPKSITLIRPEVPVEIVRIVEKLMKKDPNERYPTPGDLMTVLQEFVQVPIPPPGEKELPPLSPAAAGNASTTNRAASGILLSGGNPMVSAAQSQSGFEIRSPYASVSVPGSSSHDKPRSTAPIPAAPQAADVQVGVWATLEGDTAPRDSVDTARTKRPDSKTGVILPIKPKVKPGNRKLRFRIGGLVGLLLVAGGIGYFASKPPSVPKVQPAPAPFDYGRVYVTKGTGPANSPVFRSVIEAMEAILKRPEFDEANRKGTGPVIVLLDEKHQENPFSISATGRLKDLTIESGDSGRSVHWTTAAGTNVKRLLEIKRSHGLTVRGITFDAEGQLDYGLVLAGPMPGVKFEDVTIRGARRTAVRLENVAGDAAKPCVFNRVRFSVGPGADSALNLTVPEKGVGPGPNLTAFLNVTNCRIEGPGTAAAVAIDTALQNVEFVQNRIYNFASGFSLFQPPPPPGPWKLTVRNNTFHTILAEAFAGAEHDLPAGADVSFTRNYFANVKSIGTVKNLPAVPGFKSPDNFRDKATGDGNFSDKPKPIADYTLPAPDLEKDGSFLRYPRTAPLAMAGPNNTPVGVPPSAE